MRATAAALLAVARWLGCAAALLLCLWAALAAATLDTGLARIIVLASLSLWAAWLIMRRGAPRRGVSAPVADMGATDLRGPAHWGPDTPPLPIRPTLPIRPPRPVWHEIPRPGSGGRIIDTARSRGKTRRSAGRGRGRHRNHRTTP